MKILDKYIVKSFLIPFFATFLIILFVLVMQNFWRVFDNFAGKGISILFILKFLYYSSLSLIPQTLPIAVLLSSIMALGNLGENYEFSAAKAAGISLQRMVRPLAVLAVILSFVNFFFINNVFPYAVFKQINLQQNISRKQPAMALVEGSFNTDLPGFQIKFDEKYGEEENLLKNVLIYDLRQNNGNQKVITAEKGKLISTEGSRYITLTLYDGNYYEEHVKNARTITKRQLMAASSANFDEYEINIDIGNMMTDGMLDSINGKNLPQMFTINELNDTIPKLKKNYDENIKLRSENIYANVYAKDLYQYPDSLVTENINPNILKNFDLENQLTIINSSSSKLSRALSNLNNYSGTLKFSRKILNFYDIEFFNRAIFSLSCIILFFIGAPLGSIIRKGGFGLPIILGICIYVIYFFANTFGRNLAEDSTITSLLGSLFSAILMIPIAILLTRRATRDKGLFNIDAFLQPITKLFKKINFNKQ